MLIKLYLNSLTYRTFSINIEGVIWILPSLIIYTIPLPPKLTTLPHLIFCTRACFLSHPPLSQCLNIFIDCENLYSHPHNTTHPTSPSRALRVFHLLAFHQVPTRQRVNYDRFIGGISTLVLRLL